MLVRSKNLAIFQFFRIKILVNDTRSIMLWIAVSASEISGCSAVGYGRVQQLYFD